MAELLEKICSPPSLASAWPLLITSSIKEKRCLTAVKDILWRNGVSALEYESVASTCASGLCSAPFHSHSAVPPPVRSRATISVAEARKRSMATIRLDLPDPFGPISTFSAPSSIGPESGPKDNRLRSRRVRMNLASSDTSIPLLCFVGADRAPTFYHICGTPHLSPDHPGNFTTTESMVARIGAFLLLAQSDNAAPYAVPSPAA